MKLHPDQLVWNLTNLIDRLEIEAIGSMKVGDGHKAMLKQGFASFTRDLILAVEASTTEATHDPR